MRKIGCAGFGGTGKSKDAVETLRLAMARIHYCPSSEGKHGGGGDQNHTRPVQRGLEMLLEMYPEAEREARSTRLLFLPVF